MGPLAEVDERILRELTENSLVAPEIRWRVLCPTQPFWRRPEFEISHYY